MNIIALSQEDLNRILKQQEEIKSLVQQRKPEDIIYDNSDAIRILKVSARTLATWRETGVIKFSKVGGKIYYKPEHIEEMIDSGM